MLRIEYPSSENAAPLKQKRKVYWTTKLKRLSSSSRPFAWILLRAFLQRYVRHWREKSTKNVPTFDNAATSSTRTSNQTSTSTSATLKRQMVATEHVSADEGAKHVGATCWKRSRRLLSRYFRRCNKMHTRGDYFATISVSFLSGTAWSRRARPKAAARRSEVDRKADVKKAAAEKRSISARGA